MEPIVITTTNAISATLAYTLPTTGDTVIYYRTVEAGQLLIAAPLWALVIFCLFVFIRQTARGRM